MNVRLTRTNSHPANCDVCGVKVPAQRGYLLPRDAMQHAVSHARKWCIVCTAIQCASAAIGQDAAEQSDARELRADGSIVMPYDEKALPLLRAISEWDAAAKCWRASMLLRDRDLVLAIADKLALVVDSTLREYEDPEPVRAAVERARAVETIRDYQVEGVRWLAYRGTATGAGPDFKDKKPGAVLGDDMGLGKTLQTLLAVADDEALVIVCPANAKAVWPRQAAKWRPGRFDKVTICDGAESFVWPTSPRELVVINYDVLPWTPAQIKDEDEKVNTALAALGDTDEDEKKRKRLCKRAATNDARATSGSPSCPVLLVADEAHYTENNKALRTVRWRHIAAYCSRVIALTGTPVEDQPLKMFGLFQSARCNPFSWSSFLTQFNGHTGQWGGIEFDRVAPTLGSSARGAVKVEPGTTEILQRAMLRRTKDQVLKELPPKIYGEIPVELPAKLIKELDEIAAQHIDILLRGELPEFSDMAAVRKALALASIDAMMEVVESHEVSGIPLVVFSAHRGPIELLEKRKGWHAITGSTTSKRRGEIEDAFQRGEGFGVAGTRAMAEAMTLTRASNVLFVDRFWERKYNVQAEDRCHRIGQHDSVNVITLVPDHPLTQHVADLLSSKFAFVDAVLDGEAGYTAPPSRFTDVDATEYQARIEAKDAADKAQQVAEQARVRQWRERELAKIAEREVTPKQSEQRAKLRAERLGIKPDEHTPATSIVQAAMSFMLSVCDGAREKDDEGFNAPDSAVARWLAPGVSAGHEHAVASMVVILRHYPRQLREQFPALFETACSVARGED